jgi:hypothetical protein
MHLRHSLFVLSFIHGVAACSGDDSSAVDSGPDTNAPDATKPVDAATDAPKDVTISDVQLDVAVDVVVDAPVDAADAADAGVSDSSSDATADAFVDSGSVSACTQCSQSSCATQIQTCEQDSACLQWLQCVSACTNVSCESACDAQHSSASSLFAPVYQCACTNCTSDCAGNLEPCTYGKDGGA